MSDDDMVAWTVVEGQEGESPKCVIKKSPSPPSSSPAPNPVGEPRVNSPSPPLPDLPVRSSPTLDPTSELRNRFKSSDITQPSWRTGPNAIPYSDAVNAAIWQHRTMPLFPKKTYPRLHGVTDDMIEEYNQVKPAKLGECSEPVSFDDPDNGFVETKRAAENTAGENSGENLGENLGKNTAGENLGENTAGENSDEMVVSVQPTPARIFTPETFANVMREYREAKLRREDPAKPLKVLSEEQHPSVKPPSPQTHETNEDDEEPSWMYWMCPCLAGYSPSSFFKGF